MKKLLLLIGLISSCGYAHADLRVNVSTGQPMPKPATFVSNAVYYTSFTCVASNLNNVVIATTSVVLFNISVSSKGAGAPIIEVFDAKTSTGGVAGTDGIPAGVRQLRRINGLTERDNFFNVGLSSGLAVSNQGVIPACLGIDYSTY